MKICVCIKQVPDVAAPYQVQDGQLVFASNRMVLNAYDASAVEEALVLTAEHGGSVDLVCIGAAGATETIRKALAMGAENATHLVVPEGTALDSAAAARLLADHFADHDYDVIACGKQSQDTDAGLGGGMLATLLGLPYATNAVGLRFEPANTALVVERQGDIGREIIALPTPCLVTCSNDMNDPRIPNLKGIMAAKRKAIDTREVTDVPPVATTVVSYEELPARAPGKLLEGEAGELVAQLRDLLEREANVL